MMSGMFLSSGGGLSGSTGTPLRPEARNRFKTEAHAGRLDGVEEERGSRTVPIPAVPTGCSSGSYGDLP